MPRRLIASPCACGCGQDTPRRYRPGHDAKHKAALVAALTTGTRIARCRAADTLMDLGWGGFASPAALRDVPWVSTRGRVVPHAGDVAAWQIDHRGVHHAHRGCRTLTRTARLVGGTNPITRLASDRYVRIVATGPGLVAHLTSGRTWDLCGECAADRTRDEHVEHLICTREALRLEDRPTPKPRKTTKPTQPAPWQAPASPWDAPDPATRVAA